MATVSAIVVNYKRPDILGACLGSLREALAATEEATELIVVDNASGDGSLRARSRGRAGGGGHRAAREPGLPDGGLRGVARASGDWILLINNDVVVEPDVVRHMLAAGRSAADIGSVAAQMRFANGAGTINSAGIGVDRLGIAFDRLLGQPASASESDPLPVFGACGGAALYRRAMLDEIGGFDESFFFALDDADVAWRAQMRGWRCLYEPRAVVRHHHGATIGHGSSLKYFHVGLNRVRMLAKNADGPQLRRYGLAMVGYDLAYVGFVALTDRTPRPLRGRLQGLRGIDTGGPEAIADRSSSPPRGGCGRRSRENRVARQLGSEYGHRG